MIKPRFAYTAMALLLLGTLTVSCTSSATTTPELTTTEPVPIIWDDDGSIDGVTALLYFLEHPSYDVKAATISPGIAHPKVFAPNLVRFLEQLGVEGIPVAAGPEQPLSGDNAFPSDWRSASDRFWDLDLPDVAEPTDERTAAELIIDVVKGSEQPVTIFVSGPLTNLAQAFRINPSIKEQIRTIEVMGGAMEVAGNVWLPQTGSLPAEWNIYIDPLAASEVFVSGVEIRLTPLDATDKVEWTDSDAASWAASNNPAGSMAAQLLRQTLKDWSSSSVLIWDLVAALNVSDRGLCQWNLLYIEVAQAESRNEGQTVAVPDKATNLSVCISPDPDAYKDLAQKVFGGSQ